MVILKITDLRTMFLNFTDIMCSFLLLSTLVAKGDFHYACASERQESKTISHVNISVFIFHLKKQVVKWRFSSERKIKCKIPCVISSVYGNSLGIPSNMKPKVQKMTALLRVISLVVISVVVIIISPCGAALGRGKA